MFCRLRARSPREEEVRRAVAIGNVGSLLIERGVSAMQVLLGGWSAEPTTMEELLRVQRALAARPPSDEGREMIERLRGA